MIACTVTVLFRIEIFITAKFNGVYTACITNKKAQSEWIKKKN